MHAGPAHTKEFNYIITGVRCLANTMMLYVVVPICSVMVALCIHDEMYRYTFMTRKEKTKYWKSLAFVFTKALAVLLAFVCKTLAVLFAFVCKTLAVLLAFLHKPQGNVKTTNSTRSSSENVENTTTLRDSVQITGLREKITELCNEYEIVHRMNENMRSYVPRPYCECEYASSYADKLTTNIESMEHVKLQDVCVDLEKAIQWLKSDAKIVGYSDDMRY